MEFLRNQYHLGELDKLFKLNGIEPPVFSPPADSDAEDVDTTALFARVLAWKQTQIAGQVMVARLLCAAVVSGGVLDGPLTPTGWSFEHWDAVQMLVRVTRGMLAKMLSKIKRLPNKLERLEHVLKTQPAGTQPAGLVDASRALYAAKADLYRNAPTKVMGELADAMRGKLPSVVRAVFACATSIGLVEQVRAVFETAQWLRADNPYSASITMGTVIDAVVDSAVRPILDEE